MMQRLFHRIPYLLAALLLLMHPLVVWSLTHGAARWVALVLYCVICRALVSLMRQGDVRALMNVGFSIALALMVDARLLCVVAVLIPLLALLASPHMLRHALGSFYLVMLFPTLAVLASFVYANAVLHGLPLGIIQMVGTGGEATLPALTSFPWRPDYAEAQPMFLLLLGMAALAAFPLSVFTPLLLRAEGLISRPLLVMAVAPLVGAAVAGQLMFPDYPAALLPLLIAPSGYAAYVLISRKRSFLALSLLALGWLGGMVLLGNPVGEWL